MTGRYDGRIDDMIADKFGEELLQPRQTSAILDSIADGVYTIDLEWRITSLYMDHHVPRVITIGLRMRQVDVLTAYED